MRNNKHNSGFTLIELSIVLVIIGLIVGGILVGQDLIAAAAIRSQISQIERYNTAVNTFRGKYGYLPGDIPDPYATQFGFIARSTGPGQGDGNGIIEGIQVIGYKIGTGIEAGETAVFWVDLTSAGLLDGSFTTANMTNIPGAIVPPQMNLYMPAAKIGNGNFVYVYSGGTLTWPYWTSSGINYFGVSGVTLIANRSIESTTNISVAQAYNMDKKVDDGLPQSGKVIAQYINCNLHCANSGIQTAWAAGGIPTSQYGAATQGQEGAAIGGSAAGTAYTCYDNGGGSGPMQYSTGQNNGSGMNCALSFQFQ